MAVSIGEDSSATRLLAAFRALIRAASSMNPFLDFTVSARHVMSLHKDAPDIVISRRRQGSEMKMKVRGAHGREKNKEFMADTKRLDCFICNC